MLGSASFTYSSPSARSPSSSTMRLHLAISSSVVARMRSTAAAALRWRGSMAHRKGTCREMTEPVGHRREGHREMGSVSRLPADNMATPHCVLAPVEYCRFIYPRHVHSVASTHYASSHHRTAQNYAVTSPTLRPLTCQYGSTSVDLDSVSLSAVYTAWMTGLLVLRESKS